MITATARDAALQPQTPAEQNYEIASSSQRSFEEIASDFWDNPDRGSALDYLNSLSHTELQTISREHGFAADTPSLYGLELESSRNLLRKRLETRDEDGDGIYSVGEARTWRFPNEHTPESIKTAWESATEGMSDAEAMLMAGILYMPRPQAHTDPATGKINVLMPGEPGYRTSPQPAQADFFIETAEDALAALDDPRNPPYNIDFYRQAKAFYTALVDAYHAAGDN